MSTPEAHFLNPALLMPLSTDRVEVRERELEKIQNGRQRGRGGKRSRKKEEDL